MSLGDSISSALDKAKSEAHEKGLELIEKRGAEYFDELIEKGDDLADGIEDEDLRKEAKETIDLIESAKTPLLRLSDIAFTRLLGHWQDQDEAEARRLYLTHKATYLERRQAIWAAGDALVDSEDARRAAWDSVEEVLKKIGKKGLKFLGTVLLGMIGL